MNPAPRPSPETRSEEAKRQDAASFAQIITVGFNAGRDAGETPDKIAEFG